MAGSRPKAGAKAGEISSLTESSPSSLVVAVSDGPDAIELVNACATLAEAMGAPWEAIHVETPRATRDPASAVRVAEVLGLASTRGATIATVAAATVADGILAYLRSIDATHLVIGKRRSGWRKKWLQRSIIDQLADRSEEIMLHIVPLGHSLRETAGISAKLQPVPFQSYAYAAAFVAITLGVAAILQLFTGPRSLDLVFLFPVVAVAARLGLRPALLAAVLSVFCYNYFLLKPVFSFDLQAPQNVIMSAVLIVVSAYTSILTTRMRGRLLLSDRSARENASLAALAQRLTRDAEWESTARTVCEHVHGLLGLQTIMFRKEEGVISIAAAIPPQQEIGPVNQAALEWCWTHGEEAGAGTDILPTADWQFQPLKTSLGMLAVLALASEDGRDPVRADQRILLSTIVAQVALAHERLQLEDRMRASTPAEAA